ncbi:hypothetical protein A6A05_05045 [Magnetospirillum moscoviense]|uniref:Sel1 repeat family protein n=2 Tax=Magnetospirillum moscoviense TaxID=1437059 RepID=A0A178M572_9PROT|nr:hypothetical protein A6A05_05045 [Magnetospirillum moscoviense]
MAGSGILVRVGNDRFRGADMAREPDHIAALRRAAQEGDGAAAFQLGEAFRLGLKVPRDPREAAGWLNAAADGGHAGARHSLALMAQDGADITIRLPEAAAPVRRAAPSLEELLDGLKPAGTNDGGFDAPVRLPDPDPDPLDLEAVGDLDAVRAAATAGNAAAQVLLGNVYRQGLGIEADEVEAVAWYTKAANQGDVRGAFSLAVMYDLGLGTRKNDKEALRWYLAAAHKGDGPAEFNLGNMIRTGRGCPADAAVAAQWYAKAAAHGEVAALFALGTLYEAGQGVGADPAKAMAYYRQGAELGDSDCAFNLSNMLRQGVGGQPDPEQAAEWCRQAAEQGLAAAQLNYGLMLLAGFGQPVDPTSAAYWLNRAAGSDDQAVVAKARALAQRLATGGGR